MGKEDEYREQLAIANRLLTLLGRDIRTQLHSLLGLTDRFLYVQEIDDRMTTDYLGKMYASQEAMLNVLNDVLEISNLSFEEEEVREDNVLLGELFAEVERELSASLDMKNQSLVCTIEEEVREAIVTDERLLYEVLTKFLRYIIRHTGKNETLYAQVDVARQTETDAIYEFHLRTDNFIIPADRIMADLRFYGSVFQEISRNMDDVDMSLVVMKKYISILGGEIGLLPSEEGSAHFLLRLPLGVGKVDRDAVLPSGRGKDYRFEGVRVLLVDDDMINLEVGHRIAEDMGMEVTDAGCGQEAIDIFRQKGDEIDVIILDIRMPDMSGYEVAGQIRSLQKDGRHIPIVALTANAMREDMDKSADAGIDDHLNKPIDRHQLGETLRRVL